MLTLVMDTTPKRSKFAQRKPRVHCLSAVGYWEQKAKLGFCERGCGGEWNRLDGGAGASMKKYRITNEKVLVRVNEKRNLRKKTIWRRQNKN